MARRGVPSGEGATSAWISTSTGRVPSMPAKTAAPGAFAATSSNDGLTATLQREVRAAVGAHAYPREIRYVDALPLTVTGKVDRAALRREVAHAPA